VANDRVTDSQVVHRRADGVDPAGVLVSEDQRQLRRDDIGEPAVDDMQIGTAQPGTTDPEDNVIRPGHLGFWHIIQPLRLPV